MLRSPAIIVGVWLLTVLVSLPLTFALRGMIAHHLGASLAAESAANGVNYEWWQEFSAQATGLGETFKPTLIGFGAVLDNLSAFLDNDHRPVVIVGVAVAYMAIWLFLAGGIIDRYARDRAVRSSGFFAACGVYFFRFLRLAIVMAIVYGLLFAYVHPWLFDRLYQGAIHDVTVERTAFLLRVALYIAFGVVFAACNLVFDYAKVRAVVEDRHSMLGAIAAALRFARQNAAATVSLYIADVVLFLVVIGLYGVFAPGAGTSGWTMWVGIAVGQLYIAGRLFVKLVFWASETALFQSRLAHAGYVAAPEPQWPDSPVAEALSRS